MDATNVSTAPIDLSPVVSSQIDSIGHDPKTNTLAIRFRARAGRSTGPLYHYGNVDSQLFNAFKGSPSVGSFFHQTIKPNVGTYPFVKIDDGSAEA